MRQLFKFLFKLKILNRQWASAIIAPIVVPAIFAEQRRHLAAFDVGAAEAAHDVNGFG